VPPYKIARLGIARTFQNVTLFSRLTVLENVMVGCHGSARSGMMSAALRLPWQQREERRLREKAREQLALAGVADLTGQPAGVLSFGQRRMVEWARVMVMEPQLLLLDEPASGLNMKESEALADSIRAARARGVTILLVEHDMSLVMNVADQLVVLDFGTLVAAGAPAEVQRNPEVIKIYLGGAVEEPC
jgi:branched-chain amino acid transport system ATP-binding protein